MVEIPQFQNESSDYKFSVDLDNVSVDIRMTYNVRSGYFRMNISTENYKIDGLKVVAEFPLIYHHKALFPELPGDIVVSKVSRLDEEVDMTFDTLGTVYKMYYLDKEEIAEWLFNRGI